MTSRLEDKLVSFSSSIKSEISVLKKIPKRKHAISLLDQLSEKASLLAFDIPKNRKFSDLKKAITSMQSVSNGIIHGIQTGMTRKEYNASFSNFSPFLEKIDNFIEQTFHLDQQSLSAVKNNTFDFKTEVSSVIGVLKKLVHDLKGFTRIKTKDYKSNLMSLLNNAKTLTSTIIETVDKKKPDDIPEVEFYYLKEVHSILIKISNALLTDNAEEIEKQRLRLEGFYKSLAEYSGNSTHEKKVIDQELNQELRTLIEEMKDSVLKLPRSKMTDPFKVIKMPIAVGFERSGATLSRAPNSYMNDNPDKVKISQNRELKALKIPHVDMDGYFIFKDQNLLVVDKQQMIEYLAEGKTTKKARKVSSDQLARYVDKLMDILNSNTNNKQMLMSHIPTYNPRYRNTGEKGQLLFWMSPKRQGSVIRSKLGKVTTWGLPFSQADVGS